MRLQSPIQYADKNVQEKILCYIYMYKLYSTAACTQFRNLVTTVRAPSIALRL